MRVLPWVTVGLLVAAALVWRLDGYMVVPRLTDETNELLIGLRIARGQALPLVNVNPHIGALYNYLVAGGLLALGPRPEVGRLLVVVAGALTVVPAYLLGRSLGGPGARGQWVGLAAATLLAASATHVVVSSRIAYSHSLTPLAATTGLWLLQRALANRSGPSLVASALLFGLALQTHPSALALVPGLGLAVLLQGRTLLTARRGRWLVFSVIAVLIAVANLLAYNLLHGFESIARAQEVSERYVQEGDSGGLDWPARLLSLLRSYALALGSQVSEEVEPWELASPLVVVTAVLVALGLISFGRRRAWLPLLVIGSGLLIISLFNGRLEPVVPRARHFAPLIPLGLVVGAEGLAVLRGRLAELLPRRGLADVATVLLVLSLVSGASVSLRAYEAERLTRPDKNNLALLAVLDAVAAGGRPDERVYLDERLTDVLTMSGGRMLRHLRYALLLAEQEHAVIAIEDEPLPIGRSVVTSRRVVLSAEMVAAAEARYHLEPLAGDPGPDAPLRAFRAYARPSR